MTLSELIRFKRNHLGLSQRQLGERCGYAKGKAARNAVQSWEAGKAWVPLEKIRVVSDCLGIPLDRFIP